MDLEHLGKARAAIDEAWQHIQELHEQWWPEAEVSCEKMAELITALRSLSGPMQIVVTARRIGVLVHVVDAVCCEAEATLAEESKKREGDECD